MTSRTWSSTTRNNAGQLHKTHLNRDLIESNFTAPEIHRCHENALFQELQNEPPIDIRGQVLIFGFLTSLPESILSNFSWRTTVRTMTLPGMVTVKF